MKTAKEILFEHAAKNEDGFLTGQPKWIVEAMEEHAKTNMMKVWNDIHNNDTLIHNNFEDYYKDFIDGKIFRCKFGFYSCTNIGEMCSSCDEGDNYELWEKKGEIKL